MTMKRNTFHTLLIGLCVVLAACTDVAEEPMTPGGGQEAVPVSVSIHVGSAPMTEQGAAPATRATMPMGPALENPIRTLAVFQFDSEGTMLPVNDAETGRRQYYHFRDLTSPENPTGSLSTTLEGVKLRASGSETTHVCLLANVPQEGMDTLLYNKEKKRQLLWNEFRISTIPISYKLPPKNDVDSIGHVDNIYMFGYYTGPLKVGSDGSPQIPGQVQAAYPLSVSMARIIARLEMNIKLDEGVKIPEDKRVFFGMYNAEQSAYVFANAPQYLPTSGELTHRHFALLPVDRTDRLNQKAEVFYFYMAPHLVYRRKNATFFALWCVDDNVKDEDLRKYMEENLAANKDGEGYDENWMSPDGTRYPFAKILMCNDPASQAEEVSAEGTYWLNRNSIYRVNLTLTYAPEETANAAPLTRSVGVDGEYVINLGRLTND